MPDRDTPVYTVPSIDGMIWATRDAVQRSRELLERSRKLILQLPTWPSGAAKVRPKDPAAGEA